MNWGFDAWKARPLFSKNAVVASIPVQLGDQSRVAVVAPRDLAAVLPRGSTAKFKLSVRYKGPVRAPIRKGTELAQLVMTLTNGNKQIMPLVAAENIGNAGFLGRAWNGAKSLVGA